MANARYEQHHIVPRCLGGDDSPTNLVKLTLREHFIAHLLLCKIHPTEHKLAQAFFLMKSRTNGFVSSKTYEKLRASISIFISERARKQVWTPEMKKKMSNKLKAYYTPERKAEAKTKMLGKNTSKRTEAHKANIAKAFAEKRKLEEQKFNQSIAHLPPKERTAAWMASKWSGRNTGK